MKVWSQIRSKCLYFFYCDESKFHFRNWHQHWWNPRTPVYIWTITQEQFPSGFLKYIVSFLATSITICQRKNKFDPVGFLGLKSNSALRMNRKSVSNVNNGFLEGSFLREVRVCWSPSFTIPVIWLASAVLIRRAVCTWNAAFSLQRSRFCENLQTRLSLKVFVRWRVSLTDPTKMSSIHLKDRPHQQLQLYLKLFPRKTTTQHPGICTQEREAKAKRIYSRWSFFIFEHLSAFHPIFWYIFLTFPIKSQVNSFKTG